MSQPIDRNTAEHYTWGGDCDGWHLLKAAGLSVIEERMPPGRAETRHAHSKAQQFFYVLSGVATLEVDGIEHAIAPQQGLAVTPGTPHQLFNHGPEELRFLVISSPPSHGDREPCPLTALA
ncbi:MAG TPA: cupin domain-containing protein [Rhodocyclaceae bacterium]|nr:cupin domain-containing protein [Rhodocyclaceae bacterium]